jgi:hypothetical protein
MARRTPAVRDLLGDPSICVHSSIPVTPGEVLALVLQNPLAGFPYYGWAGVSGDMYARGGLFSEASSLGRPTFGSEPFDLAFQTFVDTTPPVPEPATFHLIASGFAVARRKLFHP